MRSQTLESNVIICTSTPNEMIARVGRRFNMPILVNGRKEGIASDWNYGLMSAETPLVTIAHQDDVYEPGFLSAVLERASAVDDAQILFTDYGELRDGERVKENELLRTKRLLLRSMARRPSTSSVFQKRNILRFGSAICCPSVTYNRDNIPLPLFQSEMRGGLDWMAWERLSRLSGSFCYIPRILMYHRIHEESETTRIIADKTRSREDLEALKRFWPAWLAHAINRLYSRSLQSNGQ